MAILNLGYNSFIHNVGIGVIDLDGDAPTAMLLNATHVHNAANSVLADIVANEISGNGYARDVLTETYTVASGVSTFNSDNAVFSAVGGSIAADDLVVFDDTPVSPADPLCFGIDLDGTQTAGAGTDFIVDPHDTQGWFQAQYVNA